MNAQQFIETPPGPRMRLRPSLASLMASLPASDHWGVERGTPVDRYYIERFLARNAADIRGNVLELLDRRYTRAFGCDVARSSILDIDPKNSKADIVADLSKPEGLPRSHFDCFLLVQTLQFVFDFRRALQNSHAMLRPGGVLLLSVPVTSQLDPNWVDCWRFTEHSLRRVLQEMPWRSIEVEAPGNVLASMAFLAGLPHEDLTREELETRDPRYPLVVLARAVKDSGK